MNAELARVAARIEPAVVAFCHRVLKSGDHTFHMTDLNIYVIEQAGEIAPDSPARILRALRRRGVVKYKVINRAASLYEVCA